ncbi:MAG: zf-HC2 domain-containing protein [Dehalococcoidia bacterium]|nr:zf-HC2 domain-containing protein [Dehalococcoidia bacterium]
MRCAEMKELLSAYANRELTPEIQGLADRHLTNCAGCRQALAAWTEVKQQLAILKEIPKFSDLRKTTMSRLKESDHSRVFKADSKLAKGVKMAQEFIFQSKWRIAVGSALVAVVIALILILPSSGGYNTALASEIARNSPDVQAAFGGDEVTVLQVVEENNIVVCSSEMRPPIAVKVDLKSKTVVAISEVKLPELTDAEKERAIDLAKSSIMIQPPIDEAAILSVEVYPIFISGTVATEIGEITLIPGPKMAIVRFDLEGDPSRVTAKVDLDAGMVKEAEMYGPYSDGGTPSSVAAVAVTVAEEVSRYPRASPWHFYSSSFA